MVNQEQLSILKQGVEVWNKWRKENPKVVINLEGCKFRGIDLKKINLSKANLSEADFEEADLSMANLEKSDLSDAYLNAANLDEANLNEANLFGSHLIGAKLFRARLINANLHAADLWDADLFGADLSDSNLRFADLSRAELSHISLRQANLQLAILQNANLENADLDNADLGSADLSGANINFANLNRTNLVGANIDKAKISDTSIYGVNIWDLRGEFEEQKDLVITKNPRITVDNIKVAQFIYLILKNEEIRNAINTLTSKTVLILGRFTLSERKVILDGLREKLREYDLLPIVFDFDRPTDKDFTETIKTLAGLCYFVIADVTNPKSSPLELQATVPDYQIPFVPIIQEGESPFAMMVDLQKQYNWVLNTVSYDSKETLLKVLKPLIIDPAMQKRQELRLIKAREPEVISAKDYLDKGKK